MKNIYRPLIIIISALFLSLSAGLSSAQDASPQLEPFKAVEYTGDSDAFGKTLIVVFSQTGNTLKLAKIIQLKTGGEIFEIKTKTAYPSGEELIPFAKTQREEKQDVEFDAMLGDLSEYQTIFFGTPVWFHDIPYPITIFLKNTNFQGKRVIPFATSGGGPGDIVKSLKTAIINGKVDDALLISRYATKPFEEIENDVNKWLNPLAAKKSE